MLISNRVKVLVTGGTGFVGGHLVEKLLSKGYQVYCTSRSSSDLTYLTTLPLYKDIRFINVADEQELTTLLSSVDYIYHLAGLIKAYRLEDYEQSNYLYTKALIDTLLEVSNKNLKRFLHLSTLAVCGPAADIKGVNEESPCNPVSDYGRTKLKSEMVVQGKSNLIPTTILRPPPVYGPYDRGLLLFFKALRRYRLKPKFAREKYVSIIYVKDLVDAIILSAEDKRSCGKTYFVANREPYSINTIIDRIEMALFSNSKVNKKSFTLKLSDGLIRKIAGFYERFCLILGLEPSMLNTQKALELSYNYWTCQAEKIKMGVGFEPVTPIEKGLLETSQWYIENGWI
ncbi:MAG: NAD-dependent epimerase/dehydratase family protein [Planctomycetota bacterium]|nr:NAD-dependent epimerase/dehydratase family protein [Planctomycetota bacterium]MDI6787442.1 NAD-dependent epimerase/dehydratase family protein [Planctomycetota bacterium]